MLKRNLSVEPEAYTCEMNFRKGYCMESEAEPEPNFKNVLNPKLALYFEEGIPVTKSFVFCSGFHL